MLSIVVADADMSSWANPTVARLAAGDLCGDDFCGAVLICSWPMPSHVLEAYRSFAARLKAEMPAEAYIYPASTLHCTILTCRAFTGGPLDDAARAQLVAAWRPVLDAARASPKWPTSDFQIKMGKPTLEGAAGIFRYEDTDGAIGRMRECLLDAVVAAGGMPAIGGGDRSKAKTLPEGPGGSHPPPHIPDIVHSTAVRWTAEPADRAAALAGFERAAATWSPQQITVTSGARAVLESTPFMHMP